MRPAPVGGEPGTVAVRHALAGDVDAIVAIERVSFTQPWSRRSLADLVDARGVVFLVAVGADGDVVGYAVVLTAADDSELANLAVGSVARRHGIGRRLLEAACQAASSAGAERMFLEVRESNASARSLYASAGFSPVGRRRRYYVEPVEDALVLRADLPHPGAPAMK
jgi:ribosomal-protein-alanine N-acetyltransferase